MNFRLLKSRVQAATQAAPFREWVFPDGATWTQFCRTGTGYLLRFPELADYEISGNDLAVTCHPVRNVTKETIRHLYLNQVLPLLWSKQGKLVIHASAVEVSGSAAAFVAESGRGKSTLAASFASSGFRFLTDDGLIVEAGDDGFQALPSHPHVRLWKDSQEALVTADTAMAPPVQYTAKGRLVAGNGLAFCRLPRPLKRVYFLGDGSAPVATFARMSATEALVGLVKNSFLLDPEEKRMLASHFDRVATLANRRICYRLDYPRRYEEISRVRQAIVEHLQEKGDAA